MARAKKSATQPAKQETVVSGWKKYLGWTIVGCIAVTSIVLLLFPSMVGLGEEKSSEQTTTKFDDNLSILILGYGGGNHAGGELTDTMILANLNQDQKRISLISIPRDLWVQYQGLDGRERQTKVNATYQLGGADASKAIAAEVTGIQPEYYAAVDFATFVRAVDTIGPLEVNVPYTFDDYFYPIDGKEDDPCGFSEAEIANMTTKLADFELEQQFGCRYEHLHFDQGVVSMNGETALKFVRSRHSGTGGGDFGRSERQQAFIQAVMKKVFSLSFVTKIVPLAQQFSAGVKTDFPIGRLPDLVSTFSQRSDFTTHSIVLNSKDALVDAFSADRQAILLPSSGEGNWTSIQQLINDEMFSATSSGTKDL